MKKRRPLLLTALLLTTLLLLPVLAACQPASQTSAETLQVVATTSIVADVVQQVAGPNIEVTTLLPRGSDPHSFQPAPRDMVVVAGASLIFANGAGLESFLQPLLDNAGAKSRVVEVSAGIQLLEPPAGEADEHDAHTGDPHTWVDPNNVLTWVDNIQTALTGIDPADAAVFQANADAYKASLRELDTWIKDQVAAIPPENRVLVTDHLVYGYFAQRYGFQQIGAIIPGFSTAASPSARELAQIEEAIRAHHVRAVFVGESTSPTLTQRVTEDTGVKMVRLYHASLSAPDGPAATYIDLMRFNVSAMADALK